MLRLFQPRFRLNPQLAEVMPLFSFAGQQPVHDCVIESGPDFLGDFGLLLDVLSSEDSLLLQDREGFKLQVDAAIDSGKSVVNFGFHGDFSISALADLSFLVYRQDGRHVHRDKQAVWRTTTQVKETTQLDSGLFC